MNETPERISIDFLPEEYRRRQAVARNRWRWAGVLVALSLVAIGVTWYQGWQLVRIRVAVKAAEPVFEAAAKLQHQITQLESSLQTARTRGKLLALLLQPWPRSQILGSILSPLAPEIRWEEISLREEPLGRGESLDRRNTVGVSQKGSAGKDPLESAWEMLQQWETGKQTVLNIIGVAKDPKALHQYLEALKTGPFVAKVDLVATEAEDLGTTGTRFTLRITIRPGYGLPGGPT